MEIKNTILQVELTNYCNNNCPWCKNSIMKREKGYMSIDMIRQIIKKIKDRQNRIQLHFYGESLLHPQLIEIIELFYQNGVQTGFYTNGELLTDKMITQLANSHLNNITISVYRYDLLKRIEKLREKSSFNMIISYLNLPKKFNSNLKSLKLLQLVDDIKKRTNKEIVVRSQGYENPDTMECSYKNSKGECMFRKNNQYWVLWNGDLITCLKDHEGKTKVGTFKDLDKVKYKNNLCPF